MGGSITKPPTRVRPEVVTIPEAVETAAAVTRPELSATVQTAPALLGPAVPVPTGAVVQAVEAVPLP